MKRRTTYDVIRNVHLRHGTPRDGVVEKTIRTAASDSGALCHVVGAPLPGSIAAGDLIVRLRYADRAAWTAGRGALDAALAGPGVDRFHGAEFGAGTSGSRTGAADATCYRALLLRVAPLAVPGEVARFEHDLLTMPRHMSSMRSWHLSRVDSACGPTTWTHVWEQRFASPEDVTGQYLDHPVHWAVVDKWFDPECPESIIRDRVCHAFCAAGQDVLDRR
ncbi:Dabb family protein [Tomitella fengzijianii]|uniref:Dabb family protein n=1 Tax=Tomitella fengzijianii TaxID=2597660 RepID=UPI001E2FE725|nr:Dabb family protein [Tomitella fengzijianii]